LIIRVDYQRIFLLLNDLLQEFSLIRQEFLGQYKLRQHHDHQVVLEMLRLQEHHLLRQKFLVCREVRLEVRLLDR
jgi:hypothetical protein